MNGQRVASRGCRPRSWGLLIAGIGFSFVLAAACTTGSGAKDAGRCVTSTITPLPGQGLLNAVDAVAPDDVWAVGYRVAGADRPASLVLHFDGTRWTTVPTPSVGELAGVVALSSRDVWVAGKQILHFDGSGWRAFQLPAPAGYRVSEPLLQADEVVNDLAASSPNDVWAAGALITDHGTNGLILHWDGARWRVEPTETLTTQWSSSFQAVKVRSATDAWVVGTRGSSPASLGGIPLAGYWNGSSWNLFPSPPEGLPIPSPPSGTLFDVALTGTSDVWVAGTDLAERGFIERWHGSEVTGLSPIEVVLHVANPPDFHSIGAASPDDVWAAGGDAIWNWDGRIWRVATRLGPGSSLLGITARAGEIWAVGSGPSGSILVEHYCPGGA